MRGHPSALVLAGDPADTRESLLLERAREWARSVAGERVEVAPGPAPPRSAISRLFAGGGRVVVLWPGVPRLGACHAAGALGDLDDGCALTLGPTYDGNLYLLALARELPALFTLPEEVWTGGRAFEALLGIAAAEGVEVGMLRPECALRTEADLRVALADPLLAAVARTAPGAQPQPVPGAEAE